MQRNKVPHPGFLPDVTQLSEKEHHSTLGVPARVVGGMASDFFRGLKLGLRVGTPRAVTKRRGK